MKNGHSFMTFIWCVSESKTRKNDVKNVKNELTDVGVQDIKDISFSSEKLSFVVLRNISHRPGWFWHVLGRYHFCQSNSYHLGSRPPYRPIFQTRRWHTKIVILGSFSHLEMSMPPKPKWDLLSISPLRFYYIMEASKHVFDHSNPDLKREIINFISNQHLKIVQLGIFIISTTST